MGSRKKLVLSALVSMVVLLAFAIGFVPAQVQDRDASARAASTNGGIAISVDGQTPVGDSFDVPVGSEQGFSAISLSDGRLLQTGEVEWSLASDGKALLTAAPEDLVATVSALEPGQAGLYASTSDGAVDLVDLNLYDLKAAAKDNLDDFLITQPRDVVRGAEAAYSAAAIYIPVEAAPFPMSINSRVAPAGAEVDEVTYTVDGADIEGSNLFPFVGWLQDLTGVSEPLTIDAVAQAAADTLQASSQAYVIYSAADTIGNGLPDDPFGLDLLLGDLWLSSVLVGDAGERRTLVTPADEFADDKDLVAIPEEGVTASLQDPQNPERSVSVVVPEGLLEEGEQGLLFLQAASEDDGGLAALLGDQAENIDQPAPPAADGLPEGAQYVEVSIVISDDGGETFAPISEVDPTRLADNPVTLIMEGLAVSALDNVRFFSHPSEIQNVPDVGAATVVPEGGEWLPLEQGTTVGNGVLSAQLTSLSTIAPFFTPELLLIENVDPPWDYSIGGAEIDITVSNLPAEYVITIDGVEANEVGAKQNDNGSVVLTVVVPAHELPEGVQLPQNTVDLQVVDVQDPDVNFDAAPFEYRGPDVTEVVPDSGAELGGTSVEVLGAGFGALDAVTFGDAPLLADVVESDRITGTTTEHSPGLVDVTVALENGYIGTGEGLFNYTEDVLAPFITSVEPDTVLNDGGYSVRITGGGFIDPAAKNDGPNQVFFTPDRDDQPNPETDDPAMAVEFLDDANLNVLTPDRRGNSKDNNGFDLSSVYVATSVYAANNNYDNGDLLISNLVDFTFVDPAATGMAIYQLDPNEGPLEGGNDVRILGAGLLPERPEIPDGPVPAKTLTEGNVLQVGTGQPNFAPSGETITIPINLFRGEDVILPNEEEDAEQAPSAISFHILFDPDVLEVASAPRSPELRSWYGHTVGSNVPTPGELRVTIQNIEEAIGITTLEQYGMIDPDTEQRGTPTGQQINPFPLMNVNFNVIGDEGDVSQLQVDALAMAGIQYEPPNQGARPSFFGVGDSPVAPNVVGLARADAEATLTQAGFTPVVTQVFDDEAAADEVIRQTPGDEPNEVKLQVAVGPAPVRVWFGPTIEGNQAVVKAEGTGPTNELIFEANGFENDVVADSVVTVVAPAGEMPGTVDVRVEDKDAPSTRFAISAAGDIYDGGYTYIDPVQDIRIVDIVNPRTGDASAYSIGGEEIEITVEEVEEGAKDNVYEVFFDGNLAEIVSVEDDVITVVAPPANRLDQPAPSADVKVRVVAGEEFEDEADFTYLGPDVDAVDPDRGSRRGGDEVAVRGGGFGELAEQDPVIFRHSSFVLRERALLDVELINDERIDGVTPSHLLGWIHVTVTLDNNYTGTGERLFRYQPEIPRVGPLFIGLLAALLGLFALDDDPSTGPCFIATAAYGTPLAGELDVLRAFRDSVLLDSAVGAALVDTYYRVSPPIAELVASSPVLSALVRALLVPVVFAAKAVLAIPQVSYLLLLMAGAVTALRLRRNKSRKES